MQLLEKQTPITEKVFIGTDRIPTIQAVHSDERRDIREVIIPQVDGSIIRVGEIAIKAAASAESPLVLGNHYHDATERFILMSGAAELTTMDHDNPSTKQSERMNAGDSIAIEPGVTHAFSFDKPAVLKSSSSATFEDAGMHADKIV